MTSLPPTLAATAPSAWTVLGWSLVGALLLMGGLWVLQRRLRNAALADLGWTVLLGLLAATHAAYGTGLPARRTLLVVMVGSWSLRLAWHVVHQRIWRRPEEGRYRRLREHWGPRADLYLLPFFLAQAVLAVLLSVPFLLAANDGRAGGDLVDVLAAGLFLVALAGETLADRQLAAFKADSANAGRTCDRGLWRLSRHPNYFFEWLVWCAYALLALPAPLGATALLAPALMLFLVLAVTGIPPSEAQAVRSRGQEYLRYRRRTSAFVPWPPRAEDSP